MPKPKTSLHLIAAKTLVHALALTPLSVLAWQFYDVWQTGSDALGADPIAEIEHRTGLWALRLLMVTLAITPLRQLTAKPVLLRFRRMLGLFTFFYACLHVLTYFGLDQGFDQGRVARIVSLVLAAALPPGDPVEGRPKRSVAQTRATWSAA